MERTVFVGEGLHSVSSCVGREGWSVASPGDLNKRMWLDWKGTECPKSGGRRKQRMAGK